MPEPEKRKRLQQSQQEAAHEAPAEEPAPPVETPVEAPAEPVAVSAAVFIAPQEAAAILAAQPEPEPLIVGAAPTGPSWAMIPAGEFHIVMWIAGTAPPPHADDAPKAFRLGDHTVNYSVVNLHHG